MEHTILIAAGQMSNEFANGRTKKAARSVNRNPLPERLPNLLVPASRPTCQG